MADVERWREAVAAFPSSELLKVRESQGWRVAAIEWERSNGREAEPEKRPIPFGLRISADCRHLEVDPTEKEILSVIVAMIAGDYPLSKIAAELNERSLRTRSGSAWTQLKIFQMLPRIIEFGPEILSERDWSESKKRLLAVMS
jgi:hypothetical protein